MNPTNKYLIFIIIFYLIQETSECGSVCSLDSSRSADTDLGTPQDIPQAFNNAEQEIYLQ